MFDVGFSELVVIGVVALIVIGPERLPKVARTVGLLVGRLQRYVNDVKADINREMELDELRKIQTQFQDAAKEVESSIATQVSAAEQELNQGVVAPVSDAIADASGGASNTIGNPTGTNESLDAAIKAAADGIPSMQTAAADIPVPSAEPFDSVFTQPASTDAAPVHSSTAASAAGDMAATVPAPAAAPGKTGTA